MTKDNWMVIQSWQKNKWLATESSGVKVGEICNSW